MTILIADQPGTNSYLTSLINAYRNAGITVICGVHNFFYSNFIPDVLHIQWPEKLYDWYPFSSLNDEEKEKHIRERLFFYIKNKVRIFHTIHNLKPHNSNDRGFTERIFRMIIEHSDTLIHHGTKSVSLLAQFYPEVNNKNNIICSHGDYLIEYKEFPKAAARKKLGIPEDKFVILNFGNQVKYKNEHFLEKVFKRLNIENKYLLTAGNFRKSEYSKKRQLYNILKTNFRMMVNFSDRKYFYKVISPSELPFFISSADVFFLAHAGNNLNSGILPLAATYGKPVVFPDLGCFTEQMEGWVFESYTPNDIKGAVNALIQIHRRIREHNGIFDNSDWLLRNSWDEHVSTILSTFKINKTRVTDDIS